MRASVEGAAGLPAVDGICTAGLPESCGPAPTDVLYILMDDFAAQRSGERFRVARAAVGQRQPIVRGLRPGGPDRRSHRICREFQLGGTHAAQQLAERLLHRWKMLADFALGHSAPLKTTCQCLGEVRIRPRRPSYYYRLSYKSVVLHPTEARLHARIAASLLPSTFFAIGRLGLSP